MSKCISKKLGKCLFINEFILWWGSNVFFAAKNKTILDIVDGDFVGWILNIPSSEKS